MNVHEAKTQLSKLLALVDQGEEVVIAKNGRPVARLIKADAPTDRRQPGLDRGNLWYSDDAHAPLATEDVDAFEQ